MKARNVRKRLRYARAALANLRQRPEPAGQLLALRDLDAAIRVNFLAAASSLGLLRELHAGSRSLDDLEARLGVTRRYLFETLVHLGCSLGELSRERDQISLRGRRAVALANPDNDPTAGYIEEFLLYDTAVYQDLPRQLRGGEPRDFLAEHGVLVARASRLVEPFLSALTVEAARRASGRVLDIGCGSGAYLLDALTANASLEGVGIDLDDDVVAHARAMLDGAGVGDRARLVTGNVLDPEAVSGPFDLVLLYQNIYYFEPDERAEVFRRIKELAPSGELVVVALVQSDNANAVHFDLELQSTKGCSRLPAEGELVAAVRQAGYENVEARSLAPGMPLAVISAR